MMPFTRSVEIRNRRKAIDWNVEAQFIATATSGTVREAYRVGKLSRYFARKWLQNTFGLALAEPAALVDY